MEPLERLRTAGKRAAEPLEQLAQRVAERAIDIAIHALDINELVAQLDLNAVLDRIDVQALLSRVDLNALLEQVDLNALIQRIDVEALVEQTDFGEIIAKQTSGIASNALDAVRSQSVSLDGTIDRGVWRLVRRNTPRPPAPELLRSPAES
jgi:transcriptional regulatory protein LevR